MEERYICIHGHFYQPPRETPWLEEVELQDSAYPFHDWNERITEECYAPNTASRILKGDEIIDIVNNYSRISFNFGPTLLSWMERRSPDVYRAILEADRLSMERFSGHGNAMAQVYNHMIMPLANSRDRRTQVIWGIRDFERRFGRSPEGMWLPETAVDTETLEIIAGMGIGFTVLAPRQAKGVRNPGEEEWTDVQGERVDPSMPYICRLPSGRSMALFFYCGDISRDVAFGNLLGNGESFAERLISAFPDREGAGIVNIATDGETYGHHHRHGDMALSYCLYSIESRNDVKLTNYGEYLERHPPILEVKIVENSSWSCIHGVERWRDNCGCSSGMHGGWNQEWRRPLREATDRLTKRLSRQFERHAAKYLKDPWRTRDDYIEVVLDRGKTDGFLKEYSSHGLSEDERATVLKLLEMQRNAMLMQTSCGWFFDEVSGPETVQVMQYAARAMHHLKEVAGIDPEQEYARELEAVQSNVFENGREVFEKFVRPSMVDLFRVCAHYAMSSIFEDYPEEADVYCYSAKCELCYRMEAGRSTFITGKARLISKITLEERVMTFAALHLGDQNINCAIREFEDEESYEEARSEINEAFKTGDIPYAIRLMDRHFPRHSYTVWHIFRDGQRKILSSIMQPTYEEVDVSYRQIYEKNYTMMNFLHSLNIPIPRPFLVASEHTINMEMGRLLGSPVDATGTLERLIDDAERWSLNLDKKIGYAAGIRIKAMMEELTENPGDMKLMERMVEMLTILNGTSLDLDLWESQNLYFSAAREFYGRMKENQEWVGSFNRLGKCLSVKVAG